MEHHHDKIQQAFTDISNLKLQVGRVLANLESEKGTIQRQGDRLTKDIEKVEAEFRTIIYDPDKGLLIKIDRLTQESDNRHDTRKHIIALWVGLVLVLAAFLLDFFSKKH